jgi:tetratricopeptide (TPR) repeat protein
MIAVAGCSSHRPAETPGAQMAFGVDMAQRGLWNEALFRFERAGRESGSASSALNNLAVAYEAVGRFDEALATYRKALEGDPGNRALKQNYSRFLEFYQAFKPRKPAPGVAGTTPPGAPAAVEPDDRPATPPVPAPEPVEPPVQPAPPTEEPPPATPPPAAGAAR